MSGDDWLRHLNEEYAEESTANSGPEEQFTGVDSAGVIQLALDAKGVTKVVTVAPDWDQSLAPDELGQAAIQAFDIATARYTVTQTESLDLGSRSTAIPRADAEDAGGSPSSPVARRLVSEIQDLAANFYSELDSYVAMTKEALTAPTMGAGPDRMISVAMSAG